MCSNITGRFREASEDGRSDSAEEGIISDSRKEVKRQERLHEAKMKKLGKHTRKVLRKEETHGILVRDKILRKIRIEKEIGEDLGERRTSNLFQVVKPKRKRRKEQNKSRKLRDIMIGNV